MHHVVFVSWVHLILPRLPGFALLPFDGLDRDPGRSDPLSSRRNLLREMYLSLWST
jgi:hypothetical protein